jgi:hypothetical protein
MTMVEADGPLWEIVADRTTWTAVLHGEDPPGCWRVQILRSGELAASRRFETRRLAAEWAEAKRAALGGAGMAPKTMIAD